jgi:hypothetical protein
MDLTPGELTALQVLDHGMSSISTRTELNVEKWIRCVQGGVAAKLIKKGLAKKDPQWNALEITESGRRVLRSYASPLPGGAA